MRRMDWKGKGGGDGKPPFPTVFLVRSKGRSIARRFIERREGREVRNGRVGVEVRQGRMRVDGREGREGGLGGGGKHLVILLPLAELELLVAGGPATLPGGEGGLGRGREGQVVAGRGGEGRRGVEGGGGRQGGGTGRVGRVGQGGSGKPRTSLHFCIFESEHLK